MFAVANALLAIERAKLSVPAAPPVFAFAKADCATSSAILACSYELLAVDQTRLTVVLTA